MEKFEIINSKWIKVFSVNSVKFSASCKIEAIIKLEINENVYGTTIALYPSIDNAIVIVYQTTELDQFRKDLNTLENLLYNLK